jgi:hypothetical protein
MKLVPYQNSSIINRNLQNNVLTVATGIADIISARCYYDLVTLVLKRMPRLHPEFIFDVLHMHRKVRR